MDASQDEVQNPILRNLASWLSQQEKIQIALVFGSFAKNTQTSTSDLDLACLFLEPLTIDQQVEWIDRISRLTGREIDLIDLSTATGTVLHEAVTNGVFLKKGSPEAFARILKRMWLENEDFEKQRQRILAERRKKVFGG